MQEEFGQEQQPSGRRRTPRLTTWVLLLVLTLVAWGVVPSYPDSSQRELQTVQATPPPVLPATGRLAEVFEAARPATVRIESHCRNTPRDHAPVGTGTGVCLTERGQLMSAYPVTQPH